MSLADVSPHWAIACAAGLMLGGCAAKRDDRVAVTPPPAVAGEAGGRGAPVAGPTAASPSSASAVPPGIQYLYGSGEAAAASIQAWHMLVAYARGAVRHRPTDSVVLDEQATLARPRFVPCGAKPLAALFDVDETVLLNLGAEYDAAVNPGPFDPAKWDKWERTGAAKVAAVPGALDGIRALRAMGVAVIFNTNRSATNAAATEAALNGAGLGPARHGETLFLQGDDTTGPLKDARRRRVAGRYCVVAMAGDQLGDFSDLLNVRPAGGPRLTSAARRDLAAASPLAAYWGAGWFVLPNPVYGTALRGGLDDIFPAATRWSPDMEVK